MWILSDYGGVLCLPQPDEDWARMAEVAGMQIDAFHVAYWSRRIEYDRGDMSPPAYWSDVLGHEVPEMRLQQLRELDVTSWAHANVETVQAYHEVENDYDFALLSNAPTDLARAVETLEWLPKISPMFFSCDLRIAKPDPRIYHEVVERMDVEASDLILVDDRIENIETAQTIGLRTLHFTSAQDLSVLRHS
jgi:putative hydrolase of the HAD superfamily